MEELVLQSKEGDHEAFRVIFERIHQRVFSYILSRTKKRDDAKDITQEVFIDLWRGLSEFSYRSEEEFYGFVFKITKRKLSKFYRMERASEPISEHEAEAGYEEYHEDHRFLLSQIETLAEKYQELLRLRYWGGMKLAEAAAVLGITENTAKVWHYRALAALRNKIAYYE